MRSATVTLTAVLLGIATTACSTPPHFKPSTTITASDSSDATSPSQSAMSVSQLRGHLLTKADLGDGYDHAPHRAAHHDDVTVQGCPALDQLGVDPSGSSLDFHRKVTASFTYGSAPSSTISEELYSDRPAKLATGTKKVFDAFVSCPQFTLIAGTRSIPVMTDKTTAPRLGDEGWAQFVVYNADSGTSITQKQVAVRSGSVVIMLSGAPGLVDSHIEAAVERARHPG